MDGENLTKHAENACNRGFSAAELRFRRCIVHLLSSSGGADERDRFPQSQVRPSGRLGLRPAGAGGPIPADH